LISRLQKRDAIGRDGKSHPIYQITVPLYIVKKLGLRKGDRFQFTYNPDPKEFIARKVKKND
jgi:bifunctional DNA-binding transcriptional regulator/antitoxin component of YhaV-PrlF toxin-antitoxin module